MDMWMPTADAAMSQRFFCFSMLGLLCGRALGSCPTDGDGRSPGLVFSE